jgi:hypothetical protein
VQTTVRRGVAKAEPLEDGKTSGTTELETSPSVRNPPALATWIIGRAEQRTMNQNIDCSGSLINNHHKFVGSSAATAVSS